MDIVYTACTQYSVTFDRTALTLMLLQVDHPTLEEFLTELKDQLAPAPIPTCPQCDEIKQFIQKIRST